MSGDEVMRIMTLAYQDGKHVQDKAVAYDEVEGIRIAFESKEEDSRWRRICVDGKIVRVEADGWVEVRKESQQVLKIKHFGLTACLLVEVWRSESCLDNIVLL